MIDGFDASSHPGIFPVINTLAVLLSLACLQSDGLIRGGAFCRMREVLFLGGGRGREREGSWAFLCTKRADPERSHPFPAEPLDATQEPVLQTAVEK